ncbi:MAG: hypothetical protein ACRD8Z_22950, partial [Nitrososphaeraceae archaeon]
SLFIADHTEYGELQAFVISSIISISIGSISLEYGSRLVFDIKVHLLMTIYNCNKTLLNMQIYLYI